MIVLDVDCPTVFPSQMLQFNQAIKTKDPGVRLTQLKYILRYVLNKVLAWKKFYFSLTLTYLYQIQAQQIAGK